jgi:hypothetical protein
MHPSLHYATVSEAISALRNKGFNLDFNLEENCIVCHPDRFDPDDFEITDVYRYEGDTDPSDQATVYGIVSKNGLKGVLVTGYGVSSDSFTTAMLKKLRMIGD